MSWILMPKGDRQIRVLVRRVDGTAHEEVDVRRLLEQLARDQRGAVAPAWIQLGRKIGAVEESPPRISSTRADGDHAFRHQVHAVQLADGWDFRIGIVQRGLEFPVQVARGDGRGGAAADDLFALLGEEQVHHLDVLGPWWRAGRSSGSPDGARGCAPRPRWYRRRASPSYRRLHSSTMLPAMYLAELPGR